MSGRPMSGSPEASQTEGREHPLYPGKRWIRGPLRIDAAVLQAIEAHAKEQYPSECCGFALGPAGDAACVDASTRLENEADKYHRLDPETFPRTSKTYFKINELKASRAMDAAEAEGRPVKVVYHSHCDAGAYFSDEDTATFSQAGTLMWPCAFLVVSVRDGEVKERKLWVHVPGEDRFEEAALHVVD